MPGPTLELDAPVVAVGHWIGPNPADNLGGKPILPGDMDGDGYGDLVLGWDGPNGAISVFRGGPTGPAAAPSATWTGYGNYPRAIGDVNGDGYADFAVPQAGTVSLFYGAPVFPGAPGGVLTSAFPNDSFGVVERMGDVNADGYDDLVVGAPHRTDGNTDGGGVDLFLGGPAGPGPNPDRTWGDRGYGANLGTCVTPAGDVNGDGYADVLVLASGASAGSGDLELWSGGPTGLTRATTRWNGTSQHRYELCSTGAGDVDGDGYDDLAVLFGGGFSQQHVELHLGDPAGPSAQPESDFYQSEALFGLSIAHGDFNGDGYQDLAIGDGSLDRPLRTLAGGVLEWDGGPNGISGAPLVRVSGAGTYDLLGTVVAAGDLYAGPEDDLVALAPMTGYAYWPNYGLGRVYAFAGFPDADRDSVPDARDACPGSTDLLDADGNGVPNGCDTPGIVVPPNVHPGRSIDLRAQVGNGEVVVFTGGVGAGVACPAGTCLPAGAIGIGQDTANASGVASIRLYVPPATPIGATLSVQASVVRPAGTVVSTVETRVVRP